MSVLKLLFLLACIVYGIRRKIFVGYLLGLAGLITPLLYGYGAGDIALGAWGTLLSAAFWRLFLAFTIVTTLGQLLKEMGAFDRLTVAAQGLAGGKKTAVATLPALIGLMPMPGGALLSAPLISEVLRDDSPSPQYLAAANYWFRHIMEFFWPVYPAVILTAGLVGLSIQKFSLMGILMSAIMLGLGVIFFLRNIKNHNGRTNTPKSLLQITKALWPFLIAVFMALVLNVDIVVALAITVLITAFADRQNWRRLWTLIISPTTFRLFCMAFGVLLFKDMLSFTGAVKNIPAEISRLGIPPGFLIFGITLLCGTLTGIIASVALSFPILAGFLYTPEINLNAVFLAYLGAFLGDILSPTHFCLVLSAEHFKIDLGPVYKVFIIPLIILALIGIALYLVGYPWHLIPLSSAILHK